MVTHTCIKRDFPKIYAATNSVMICDNSESNVMLSFVTYKGTLM